VIQDCVLLNMPLTVSHAYGVVLSQTTETSLQSGINRKQVPRSQPGLPSHCSNHSMMLFPQI
jgi:hypothetical protein